MPGKGHLTQSNPIYSTCPISPYNLGMAATAPDKPHILLVSLDINFPFDQLYQRLLGKLNNMAAIDQATKPESALQGLANRSPRVVLVTDGGIAKHYAGYAKFLGHVRSGGR
jgi:hypothetical protein